MAVSFLSQPPKLVLSGNHVNFKVLADNYLLSVGVKAKYYLAWNVHDNEVLGLTFKGIETRICAGIGQDKYNYLQEDLASYLSRVPFLFQNFNITKGTEGGITRAAWIEAKVQSTDKLTISYHSPEGAYEGEYHLFTDVFGQNRTKNIFHRVCASIITKSSIIQSSYQASDPEDIQVNPLAGQSNFNISNALKKTGNTRHFTFPELSTSKFIFSHDILEKIKVYVFEQYGVPTQVSQAVFSNDIYVLQGKLSNTEQGELNDLQKSFYSDIISNGRFLTDQSFEKTTDIYAPERLYWFCNEAFFATLKISYFYSDGTSETKSSNLESLSSNTIVEIVTSYKQIRLNTTKKILKYSVQLFKGVDPVSTVQSYVIDYNYQSYARYFYIKNRYGVYDLLRTVGKASKKQKITKQSVTIQLPEDFKSTDSDVKQVSSSSAITYNINSGFLKDSKESQWLGGLLESIDSYWLKKGKAYPTLILESDNPVYRDGEPNNFFEFDLRHANNDDIIEEFSPLEPIILQGDYSVDYNTDYFTNSNIPVPDPEPETDTLLYEEYSSYPLNLSEQETYANPVESYIENQNLKIVLPVSPGVGNIGVRSASIFNITTATNLKVTIKIDEISNDNDFVIQLVSSSGYLVSYNLKTGENIWQPRLTSQLIGDIHYRIINNPATQNAYPINILIDYIKIEKI